MEAKDIVRRNTDNDSTVVRLPDKTGVFSGEKGNSDFYPADKDAVSKLEEFGQSSVTYRNNRPDFSPFTSHSDERLGDIKGEVKIGHMTTNRENPTFDYGRRTDSHSPSENLGNFRQADNELAKKLSKSKGREITGKDIEKYRKDHKLTWHECEDGATMQLVPSEIHKACPHSGGVAEIKSVYREIEKDKTDGIDPNLSKKNSMEYTYDYENDRLYKNNSGFENGSDNSWSSQSATPKSSTMEDKRKRFASSGNAEKKKKESHHFDAYKKKKGVGQQQ